MNFINYISVSIVPIIISLIVIQGAFERKKVFELFLAGAKEGMKISISLLPTLIGLFFAVGFLRASGILDFFSKVLAPLISKIGMPAELVPLALVRPISGGAAIAVASDIMKNFGVDSFFGRTAGIIMGSTETTLYTIAVYSSAVKIKNSRGVLWAALVADAVGIVSSVVFCRLLS